MAANTVSDAIKDKYVSGWWGLIGFDGSSYSHNEQEKINKALLIRYYLFTNKKGRSCKNPCLKHELTYQNHLLVINKFTSLDPV